MTRDAVIGETPACLATSRMVTDWQAWRLRGGMAVAVTACVENLA